MTKKWISNFRVWREKNLSSPIHPYKLLGVKVATIGLIIGTIGALIAVAGAYSLGKFIFILGALGMLTGFAITLVMMLTSEDELPKIKDKKDKRR